MLDMLEQPVESRPTQAIFAFQITDKEGAENAQDTDKTLH
jgi:hypothetical protein